MLRAQPIHRVERYVLLARRPSLGRQHPAPPSLRRTPHAPRVPPAGPSRHTRAHDILRTDVGDSAPRRGSKDMAAVRLVYDDAYDAGLGGAALEEESDDGGMIRVLTSSACSRVSVLICGKLTRV
jgi:hypothetical protein